MSMIERLGIRYCQDYLSGALMIYNGRPALIGDIGDRIVRISYVDTNGGREDIPHAFFTGWKVLAYPELGYRRVGNVTYHVQRSQSAYRGLRPNTLNFENTPVSYLLVRDEQTAHRCALSNNPRLAAVMLPQYDGNAELDALLRGELVSVVPNQNICIEPSLNDNSYAILYRTKMVGSMTADKRFIIDNPAVLAEVQAAFRE